MKLPATASILLLLAGAHLLALGSFHDHDRDAAIHLSTSHDCFLCQVSPNVLAEICSELDALEQPNIPAPETPVPRIPAAPFLRSGSARSPPR